MKIGLFRIQILIILVLSVTVSGKSIGKRDAKDSDERNLVAPVRYAEEKNQLASPSSTKRHSEEDDDISNSANLHFKVPKINNLGTHCYDVPSSKRSTENDYDSRNEYKNPYSKNAFPLKTRKRNSPYGIVYNQGKPIGILEPISQVFEFSNFKDRDNSPRDRLVQDDMIKDQVRREYDKRSIDPVAAANVKFTTAQNDKYANILTNFKIGNRVKTRPLGEDVALYNKKNSKMFAKRSAEKETETRTDAPNTMILVEEKNKRELSDKNLNEIEDNLKEIMNDLGLISDDKIKRKRDINDLGTTKREAYAEDEDLEKGINKIGLTKETPSEVVQRNKKENCPGKTGQAESDKQPSPKRAEIVKTKDDSQLEGGETNENFDNNRSTKKAKHVSDYRAEGEAFIRSKRQQANNANDNSKDVLKGLESSGDLTVSGNKSPLASSSSSSSIAETNETKHKTQRSEDQKRDNNEDTEYEKRLQRNIQNKISEIKEEVKREITAMKKDNKVDSKAKNLKRDATNSVRNKRNLLNSDANKSLDPGLNLEEKLVPHVRKRRETGSEGWTDEQLTNEDARVTWEDLGEDAGRELTKREEPKIHNNPKLYEFQYRVKRTATDKPLIGEEKTTKASITNMDNLNKRGAPDTQVKKSDASQTLENAKQPQLSKGDSSKTEKRSLENKLNVGDLRDKAVNFWDVQNHNVAKTPITHALASRSTEAKDALVAQAPQLQAKLHSDKQTKDVKRSSETTKPTESSKSVINQENKKRDTRSIGHTNIEIEVHSGTSPTPALISHRENDIKAFEQNEQGAELKRRAKSSSTSQEEPAELKGDNVDQELVEITKTVEKKMAMNGDKQSYPQTVALIDSKPSAKKKVAQPANLDEDGSPLKDKVDTSIQSPEGNADNQNFDAEATLADESKLLKENKESELDDNQKISEDNENGSNIEASKLTADVKFAEDRNSNNARGDTNVKVIKKKSTLWSKGNKELNNADVKEEEEIDDDTSKLTPDALNMNNDDTLQKGRDNNKQSNKRDAKTESKITDKMDLDQEEANNPEMNVENNNREESKRSATRKERMLEPSLTLDEIQRIDSANDMKKRKRRSTRMRKKRDDMMEEGMNMQFRNYKNDDEDADDDENDEFDDDNFDDRTANMVRKRAASLNNVEETYDEDYAPVEGDKRKRETLAGQYVAKMNADAYGDPNFLYDTEESSRMKREALDEDMASLHGGGPMTRHIAAARERHQQSIDNNYRMKRLERLNKMQIKDQSITGLSESDIFGGLPQSYEGELSRFKRVKREEPNTNS